MGKRRKRMTMAKYATKYAAKRAAMEARRGVIEIDMNTGEETTEDEFIQFREARDATLNAPRLLLPSIQVNIDAGHLPLEEENGVSYLKIPIRAEDN